VQPWFWHWNYADEAFNNVYRKMAPDDLHTLYGGVLGKHFINVLKEAGAALPMGKVAFMTLMDGRLHDVYNFYRPSGLRLPSKKNFFTEPCNTPAYEWKAILQVLPLMVVGLCRIGGRDALAEWAVAMAEWVHYTFWTPEGAQDDNTLAMAKSNELLYVFEKKCDAIAGLQASNWNFRKMHETSKFTDFIKRLGAARWYSTEKGERRHQPVKKWWKEMNGKNIEKSLNRWWVSNLYTKQLR
jgi:hypothetical protein